MRRVMQGGLESGLKLVYIGGGGWGLLIFLGRIIRKIRRLGFGIWAWIPLFWAVAPVRSLTEGDGGRFDFGFETGGRQGGGVGGAR